MTQAEIDRLRTAKIAPQQLLIGGGWRASESEAAMEVISPIDGKAFTSIASGSKADTEAAVAAARSPLRAPADAPLTEETFRGSNILITPSFWGYRSLHLLWVR